MTTPPPPTDPQEAIKELTLALLYLTRFSWDKNEEMRHSWKTYDWDSIDRLVEQGLIDAKHKNKSVYITNDGISKALELLKKYHIKDWES